MPTDELNGPTTPKARAATAFLAARSPPAAVAPSSTLTRLSLTPSTPPAALICLTASWAPRAMSIPVAAWAPVIGPSTAMTPGLAVGVAAAAETVAAEQPRTAARATAVAPPIHRVDQERIRVIRSFLQLSDPPPPIRPRSAFGSGSDEPEKP